jgi:hypothetical protein
MKCADARRALLEAELDALEGVGDGPLARHVRECPGCSSVARAILEGEAALSEALRSAAPRVDPQKVLDLAGEAERAVPRRGVQELRTWRRPARALAFLPLAAAAAATAFFLGRPPSLPGPPYAPPAAAGGGLDVQAPGGNAVAVLQTNNPEITVLWLLDGGS